MDLLKANSSHGVSPRSQVFGNRLARRAATFSGFGHMTISETEADIDRHQKKFAESSLRKRNSLIESVFLSVSAVNKRKESGRRSSLRRSSIYSEDYEAGDRQSRYNLLSSLEACEDENIFTSEDLDDSCQSAKMHLQEGFASLLPSNGKKKNILEAIMHFERAAAKGSTSAAFNLGVIHQRGMGVDTNFDTAITWYKKAMEGNGKHGTQAAVNLARMHQEGEGVPRDVEQALKLLAFAADRNDIVGKCLLADAFAEGVGVAFDMQIALSLYQDAANAGNMYAAKKHRRVQKLLVESRRESSGYDEQSDQIG
eukprot:m.47338 g.47338  ORF g.47338 m.47338 type:complete len:312 (-) comp10484_c1_seq1:55-990(-)